MADIIPCVLNQSMLSLKLPSGPYLILNINLLFFFLTVPILLSQLKSEALDAYERVWKRLDKIPEGTNKGDFRDVAKDFEFAQEDIWELEKEFKASASGSPSRQLLECLETRRPQLTVPEFVEVLQKPNIDRDDIGDILKDYQYFQVNRGGQINPW